MFTPFFGDSFTSCSAEVDTWLGDRLAMKSASVAIAEARDIFLRFWRKSTETH